MAGRPDPPFSAANWIQRSLTSMMTPSWSRMATFISSAAKIGLCSCRVKGGWIAHLRRRGRGVLPFYFPAPPTLRLGVMIGRPKPKSAAAVPLWTMAAGIPEQPFIDYYFGPYRFDGRLRRLYKDGE